MRLQAQLARYFADVLGETVLIPEVMPMGWQNAAKIIQAISTVVALYREGGGSLAADKE